MALISLESYSDDSVGGYILRGRWLWDMGRRLRAWWRYTRRDVGPQDDTQ